MKTKNRKGPTPVASAPATIEDFSSPAEARPEEPKKKDRFQLSFDLNEDGSPDLAGMREGTKRKVVEFFSDPKIASAFGAPRPAQPEIQVFHPAMISGMYDLLGAIEASVFSSYMKIPEPVAKQVFSYSPQEKTALEGPTVRVLNKYAAEWMIRYQDEIALATLLVSLTVAKVSAARAMAKMYGSNIREMPRQEENVEKDEKGGGSTPVQ